MTPVVKITPAAEADIAEARDWYGSVSPELSSAFRKELDDLLIRIADSPHAYVTLERGLRRAFLRHFPHAVFYRSQAEAIQVVAVIHPSRNPSVWQARNH